MSTVVETITVSQLEVLEWTYLHLSDEIKNLKLQIANHNKTELDFFRYLKPLANGWSPEVRWIIKEKFWAAVIKFLRLMRTGLIIMPPAIVAL